MSYQQQLPREFTYRGMTCECVEINAYGADSVIFLLGVPLNRALEFAEIVPHDIVFRAQVAMLFDLTVTDVNIRIETSDTDDPLFFYINCKTVSSVNVMKSYSAGGLLAYSISRLKYQIGSFTSPFIMRGVKMGGDEFDIHGITSGTLIRNINLTQPMRFFYSYCANITINISNEYDVEEDTDGRYHTFGHHALLLNELIPAIDKADSQLSRFLSPNGSIHIEYDHLLIYDQIPEANRYGLSFKVIIIPKSFNGIEVEDVSQLHMVLRPKKADDFFANTINMNMNVVYLAIEQFASALMSDSTGLYIPQVVDHEFVIIDGKQWMKVFFSPHLCSFHPDILHYSLPQEVITPVVKEFAWLFSGEHGIILSFPTGNSLNDPTVLCYGKADPSIFATPEYAARFVASFTSEHLSLRILARTEAWIFFAIVDNTSMSLSKDDLEPDHFAIPFYQDIGVNEIPDETALTNLYRLFFSCYNFGMATVGIEPEIMHKITQRYGSNPKTITAILWEAAVDMGARSWCKTAEEVRNRVIEEMDKEEREAMEKESKQETERFQLDLTSDDPSIKPVDDFEYRAEDADMRKMISSFVQAYNPEEHQTSEESKDESKEKLVPIQQPIHHDSILDKFKKFFK